MTLATTDVPHPKIRMARRLAAGMGSVCVLVAAWLLLVTMSGALDQERAFKAAVSCAPGDRDDDCLWTVAARIDRTEPLKRRKSSSYWLYVAKADGTSSRTRFKGSPQEPPIAHVGGTVEVTYWRGQIRYVDFESARRYTTADPRGDYKLFCAWGLAIGFQGLAYLWCWYWWARRSHVSVRASPWQLGVPLVGALCLTGIGAAATWPTDSPGAALRFVALCTPVVLAGCSVAALVLWRRQRGDDTIALTPSVPATEQCFLGMILGEIPYAGSGGYLVAGPGCLASTPDPTGAFFRREAPHSLTPLRVRPPYWTDPAHPDYDGRALVLECEDNGVPVFIVTHRKKMPWVLGALQPIPATNPPRP
ncbi:hypothetical protein [Streptomyces sp. ISL-100]|uniref:hypothetical protein n=1 Tax=Streptomyces sp. ISL-100 TaxID=2819173 RepID=UPI001BE684A1|nr:hypothetical protein [Streptomyces sp. ISL-100]MBT2396086.1 hypothetical protein [Streptomyces sp. ISL-100]